MPRMVDAKYTYSAAHHATKEQVTRLLAKQCIASRVMRALARKQDPTCTWLCSGVPFTRICQGSRSTKAALRAKQSTAGTCAAAMAMIAS